MNQRMKLASYGLLLTTISFGVISCGDFTEDTNDFGQSQQGIVFSSRTSINANGLNHYELATEPLCKVPLKVSGKNESWDLEEYIKNVVICESGATIVRYVKDEKLAIEAFKAQAIAARSWAKAALGEQFEGMKRSGTPRLISSESHQVFHCDKNKRSTPQIERLAQKAVEETAGIVMTHDFGKRGRATIFGFYVAGDSYNKVKNNSNQCHELSYYRVTNNQGKVFPNKKIAQVGGTPSHPLNHGGMAQNGAACFAGIGWSYKQILEFYYGKVDLYRMPTDSCGSSSAQPSGPVDDAYDTPANTTTVSEPAPPKPPVTPPSTVTCESGGVSYNTVTRAEWGALPNTGERSKHTPKSFVIHHTGTSNSTNQSEAKIVKEIQSGQMKKQGFSDIAYHYVVGKNGDVFEGTNIERVGAHYGGHNENTIGIALIGNYGSEEPSQTQLQVAASLIKNLAAQFDINVDSSTLIARVPKVSPSASSKNLYSAVPSLIDLVNSRMVCDTEETRAEGHPASQVPGEDGNSTQPGENPVSSQPRTVKYVKLVAKDGDFNVESVFAKLSNNQTIYPSGNAKVGKEPTSKTCDETKSESAVIPDGSEMILKFSQGFGNSDQLHIVQTALPAHVPCDLGNGKLDVYTSENGSDWHQVGVQAEGNQVYSQFVVTQGGNEGPGSGNGLGGIFDKILDMFNLSALKDGMTIGKHFKLKLDPQEGVASIEFFANGVSLGITASKENGFEVNLEFEAFGRHNVVGVARDKDGKIVGKVSSEVNVTEDGFGFVTPQDGKVYGNNLKLEVSADKERVKSVRYESNGKVIGVGKPNNNFQVDYQVATGSKSANVTIKAIALDTANKEVGTTEVSFVVNPNAGSLAITSPTTGQVTNEKTTLKVDANSEQIVKVSYFVDNKEVGSSTNKASGYAVDATFTGPKNVTVKAIGYDAQGKEVASQSSTFTVTGQAGQVPHEIEPPKTTPTTGLTYVYDSELGKRLAQEGAKAWEAGNKEGTCSYLNNTPYSRKNRAKLGHMHCDGSGNLCLVVFNRCYAHVKGAIYRGINNNYSVQQCTGNTTSEVYTKTFGGGTGAAYQFHELAQKAVRNNVPLSVFPFREDTSVKSPREAKLGSIVVWNKEALYYRNNNDEDQFDEQYGHIEVVVKPETTCSDFCHTTNRPRGSEKTWHVYMPVKAQ